MRTILAVALLVASVLPGAAEVRILASPGGQIGQYLNLFAMVRQSGERVVIDGPCLSACTLVLSVLPKNRICVTRKAILGFHAAWNPDRRGRPINNMEATKLMFASYPGPVRNWINRHGGLTSRTILLRGRDLAGMYRVCT